MRWLVLNICLLITLACHGQSNSYQLGILPAINFNKKFENNWRVHTKTESRQRIKQGLFNERNDFQYEYMLTDFTFIVSKRTGFNNYLANGYTLRLQHDKIIHRWLQQFTMIKKYPHFKLAHRIATDFTFEEQEKVAFRLRYRVATAFPLNGQSTDAHEYYFKFNHEYLNSFQGTTYDLEIRCIPLLGYKFSDINKLESGLDYRVRSFIDGHPNHHFWIKINWFVILN